jgi:hypothetical protein
MIAFIDESGDAGFKIGKGSSPYFVIAVILFEDEINAEETALSIKKLRRSLGKPDDFEFKFNKCNRQYREQFFAAIENCSFSICAIVFNKRNLYSNYLRENKKNFYNYALKMVLERNSALIKDAKIRLDSSGEKAFRAELTTYLRRFLNTTQKHVMQNLRFRDSKKDVLIQLADMVAGSLKKDFENLTNDAKVYRKYFKKKESNVWEFK